VLEDPQRDDDPREQERSAEQRCDEQQVAASSFSP
jgi:hypothetical protein